MMSDHQYWNLKKSLVFDLYTETLTLTHSLTHSLTQFLYFIRLVLSCLVLSCLVSLMATLEEKIRDLKAEIAGYEEESANAAPGSDDKISLLAIITVSKETLSLYVQQQQQGE